MVYLGFDVGGSSVKYALIDEEGKFLQKGHFPTPDNLESFYEGAEEGEGIPVCFTGDCRGLLQSARCGG
jgi:predicted NBD/HSP70 family sugar kinase